jgi:hypothetical protein
MDLSPNQGKKKKLKTSNFAQTIKQTTPASNSINLWPTQHQIESIDQKKTNKQPWVQWATYKTNKTNN